MQAREGVGWTTGFVTGRCQAARFPSFILSTPHFYLCLPCFSSWCGWHLPVLSVLCVVFSQYSRGVGKWRLFLVIDRHGRRSASTLMLFNVSRYLVRWLFFTLRVVRLWLQLLVFLFVYFALWKLDLQFCIVSAIRFGIYHAGRCSVVLSVVQFGWLSRFSISMPSFSGWCQSSWCGSSLLLVYRCQLFSSFICFCFFVSWFISRPSPSAAVFTIVALGRWRRGMGWFGTVNVGYFVCLWSFLSCGRDSCLFLSFHRITEWLWWLFVFALRCPSLSVSTKIARYLSASYIL